MQISLMLAVPDAGRASAWYQTALGATELWSLGSVRGLEIKGAPFFLGEPANNGWESPSDGHLPSCRIEVFSDNPDAFVARAKENGAHGDDRCASTTPAGASTARAASWTRSATSGWSATNLRWSGI